MRRVEANASMAHLCELAAFAGRLHFYGNGASATMASHMATDWTRRAKLKAWAYSDAAWLTATANDAGYERVFADTLHLAEAGDLVCCISASGKSPNILAVAREARAAGHPVVTFSGFDISNPLRCMGLGTVNVYAPSERYGIVETVHAAFLHAWLDSFCELYVDK